MSCDYHVMYFMFLSYVLLYFMFYQSVLTVRDIYCKINLYLIMYLYLVNARTWASAVSPTHKRILHPEIKICCVQVHSATLLVMCLSILDMLPVLRTTSKPIQN